VTDLAGRLSSNCRTDILETLDVKALPYVIFLVVPVLGRMSDTDDDIRSTATNTFASLVKMVPLEVHDF
jgi:TATA-binding protein-associated factor